VNDLGKLLSEKLEEFKWRGEEWAGARCPFPEHHDPTPSFRINMERGFFYCFGCQRSGSMADLLKVLGLPEASVQAILSAIQFVKAVKKHEFVEVLPEYILAAFRHCPTSLLEAGFDKEILKENDIGFDFTHFAPTYPLRDKDGILVAVYRRTDDPKYKYLVYDFAEFDGYKAAPKKHLWGLHKYYKAYLEGDRTPLVVTEGFKACLWVMQNGYNAVATMGTAMTKDQVSLLSLLDAPTIIMFDNDEAGQIGATQAHKKLQGKVENLKFCFYETKQPDDLTNEQVKTALNNPRIFTTWRKECQTMTIS
jgi:DNA primase